MRPTSPSKRRLLHSRTGLALIAVITWTTAIAIDVSDVPIIGGGAVAHADWDPCATPAGYLQICCPKPCPVLDPIKLPSEITKAAAEIQKLQSMLQQATGWMQTLQTIGQDISKLMNLFSSMGGMANSLKGMTNFPAVTLPQTISGTSLTDITALRNALTKLFTVPQSGSPTQLINDRLAMAHDTSLTAIATGLNGRSAISTNLQSLNDLAQLVAKATNTREDMAAGAALRIAMLKSLNSTTQTTSILNQLGGIQQLLSLAADSSQVASLFGSAAGNSAASSSPFNVSTPSVNTTPPANAELASTAGEVSAAVNAADTAIDLHNALAASQEMQAAIAEGDLMKADYTAKQAVAQSIANDLATQLAPYYANPASVAEAIINTASPQITVAWPDSVDRTAQESGATGAIASQAKGNPNSLGQFICVEEAPTTNPSTGQTTTPPSCAERVAAVIDSGLYAVLDANSQANWYYQFYTAAQTDQATLQSEITNLTAVAGVDVSNTAAVNATIADYVATATAQLSAAGSDPNITGDNAAAVANGQANLQQLAGDPGALSYLSYDSSEAPVPTSAALQAANP